MRDFHVRADRIKSALEYLKLNNPFYCDIEISTEALAVLPEDGNVYQQLRHMAISEEDEVEEIDDENLVHGNVPGIESTPQEDLIQATLDPQMVSWPTMESAPINEFDTEGYIVRAFPALFPSGKCDLRDYSRSMKITADQYFKRLLKYKDGRFAKDPRFRFFAMRW